MLPEFPSSSANHCLIPLSSMQELDSIGARFFKEGEKNALEAVKAKEKCYVCPMGLKMVSF
jgi:hypothetical protein